MRFGTSPIKQLSITSILELVSEENIFRYYFREDLEIGKAYCSPLRKDNKPSFSIYSCSGKMSLRYKDHKTGENGTCFNFIQNKYNCNFIEALRIINTDFRLGLYSDLEFDVYTKSTVIQSAGIINTSSIPQKETEIKVLIRPWNNKEDKDFWLSHGIDGETLTKYKVFPLKQAWITKNDKTFTIYGTKSSPMYGYYFGNDKWKIYRPFDSQYKWFSNTDKTIVQGLEQLKTDKSYIIVTKALKEVMLLHYLGIPAIAPQSESTLLSLELIEDLKSKFEKIYINFDFDYTGVMYGNFYKKQYNLIPLYFTNGKLGSINYKAKDLTDYCKLYGIKKTELLINSLKKSLS